MGGTGPKFNKNYIRISLVLKNLNVFLLTLTLANYKSMSSKLIVRHASRYFVKMPRLFNLLSIIAVHK